MPIVYIENSKDYLLGLWEISETLGEIINLLVNSGIDYMQLLDGINSEKYKRERLASRILALNLGVNPLLIKHKPNGKPFILESDCCQYTDISIAHSGKYAGIILSRGFKIGIDVQFYTPVLEKVKEKFLSLDEKKRETYFNSTLGELYLLGMWCAKEAAYKALDNMRLPFYRDVQIIQAKKNGSLYDIECKVPDATLLVKGFWVDEKYFCSYCVI